MKQKPQARKTVNRNDLKLPVFRDAIKRLALTAFCVPYTASAVQSHSPALDNESALAAASDVPAPESETVPNLAEVSPTLEALFQLPESNLKTECSAAEYYPDQQVKPEFYGYPRPPEFEKYAQCLLAEARRDGGKKRLASALSFPKIGTCYSTQISMIGTRWGDSKPSHNDGTAVLFTNHLYLIDYGLVRNAARSKVGDRVQTCVLELPQDCPGHDLRGIAYRTRNLRTGKTWIMGDSQHVCRGA